MKMSGVLHVGIDYSIKEDQEGVSFTFNDRYKLIAFMIDDCWNRSCKLPRKKKKILRNELFKKYEKEDRKKIIRILRTTNNESI